MTSLKFLVLNVVQCDVIIGQSTTITLGCKMLEHVRQSKTLELEYEPDLGYNTEDAFTVESKTEAGLSNDSLE